MSKVSELKLDENEELIDKLKHGRYCTHLFPGLYLPPPHPQASSPPHLGGGGVIPPVVAIPGGGGGYLQWLLPELEITVLYT